MSIITPNLAVAYPGPEPDSLDDSRAWIEKDAAYRDQFHSQIMALAAQPWAEDGETVTETVPENEGPAGALYVTLRSKNVIESNFGIAYLSRQATFTPADGSLAWDGPVEALVHVEDRQALPLGDLRSIAEGITKLADLLERAS